MLLERELVARYVVVAYCKSVSMNLRNLYWMREMEARDGSREMKLLSPARFDAQALVEIHERAGDRRADVPARAPDPGLPLICRLASGFTFEHWWIAVLLGLLGVEIGLGISWVVLRGAALASRRIRQSVKDPLKTLLTTIGYCGNPPKDQSRKFAIVAITLTVGVWIVLPVLVTVSLTT